MLRCFQKCSFSGIPGWPEIYIRKLVRTVHPDVFATDPELATSNQRALSSLNAIVSFAKQLSRDKDSIGGVSIPAGSVPASTQVSFYCKPSEMVNGVQRISVDFLLPKDCQNKSSLMRAHCNQFLVDLLKKSSVDVPMDVLRDVKKSIADDFGLGVKQLHATTNIPKKDSPLVAAMKDLNADAFSVSSIFGDDEEDWKMQSATKKHPFESKSKSGPSRAPRYDHHMDDFLTQFEVDIVESPKVRHAAVKTLLGQMMKMKLIFFGNELNADQRQIALRSFSRLLLYRWQALQLRSWFGIPILFADKNSTTRAPGFIGVHSFLLCVY